MLKLCDRARLRRAVFYWRWRLAWISCLAFLALSGCSGRDAEPPAIRIGVLGNATGSEGPPTREATEMAVSSINAAGGLDVGGKRRPVELLFEDTQTSPGEAIHGARRLIQGGAVAILGPGRSREAIAVAGVVESARIPMISATSTHPQATAGKRYVYRMSFTDTFQGEALGRFAAGKLEARSAAVLYDVASAYNEFLATAFRRSFEASGGKIVAFESYTTGESDFRRQLERIRDADPQVLFLPNYDEEIPQQVQQARDLGIDATLLGGESWTLIDFDNVPQFEGAYFGRHWHHDEAETRPQARRFLEAYRQAYGHAPTDLAALTYDAIHLLFSAIGSGGDDPDRVQQALASIEGYEGVTGIITYLGMAGDPPRRLIIAQVRQGKTVMYEEITPSIPGP